MKKGHPNVYLNSIKKWKKIHWFSHSLMWSKDWHDWPNTQDTHIYVTMSINLFTYWNHHIKINFKLTPYEYNKKNEKKRGKVGNKKKEFNYQYNTKKTKKKINNCLVIFIYINIYKYENTNIEIIKW